jgi:hypothetical protein
MVLRAVMIRGAILYQAAMDKEREREHKATVLQIFVLVGLVYITLMHFRFPVTGIHQMDGILGVLLGLYGCSHPAGNLLGLLLYRQYLPRRGEPRAPYYYWWGLNLLVLLIGWVTIVNGLLRFADKV